MSREELNMLLERIAERMVMDDLSDAAARAGLAQCFAEVRTAQAGLAAVCTQAETLLNQAPADLSAQLEVQFKHLKNAVDNNTSAPVREAPVESAPASADGRPPITPDGLLKALPPECDPDLLREFLVEAREHMENSDAQLLILEQSPKNEEALNAVFRAFHSLKGLTGFLGLFDIQRIAHESESLLERARQGTIDLAGPFFDITFEAVDALKKLVQNVEALQQGGKATNIVLVPEMLAKLEQIQKHSETAAPAPAAVPVPVVPAAPAPAAVVAPVPAPVTERMPEIPATPVKTPIQVTTAVPAPAPITVHDAPRSDQAESSADRAAGTAVRNPPNEGMKSREVLKVDAERLDRLVDMIGELVIAESMVSQASELRGASTVLARHLGQLDKITRELQEIGTSLRMIPIKATFQKMARLVRDVARKSNKQVEFVTTGEDTELDKTVVEKIGDPLVHMIRNSVDHGIECDPQDRIARGKPAAGRVELKAYHRGGNIYIEIVDDGRGLNKEAILAKARERGLVADGEMPTDREIYNLIFAPGLSTAKAITDVSGRGVGMDVVKRNIEALRGQIDIQTEVGRGTTFVIRLPLTLAIIDGMLVRTGTERYIIPTLSVVRSVRPSPSEIETVFGQGEMLKLQDRLIPVYRLHKLFGIERAERNLTQGLVVVVEDDGRRAGIFADELLGQQQIVIKSLGDHLRELPGISGGAIMPDGHVGLILDVGGLVRLAQSMPNAKSETTEPVLQATA